MRNVAPMLLAAAGLNPSSARRVPFRPGFGRPFGTWSASSAKPSVETLGYSRMSLRDKDCRAGQGNFRKALNLASMLLAAAGLNPSSAGRVPFRGAFGRPFGTWGVSTAKPSVETLGYSRMSLRDKDRRAGQGNFRKALNLAPILLAAAVLCGCASGPKWKQQAFAFALPADPPTAEAQTNIVALNRLSISPLFQSRSFTYRTAESTYEQDPYAGFFIPPERALEEPIRAWMRGRGLFGRVVEPGSALTPTLMAEVSVNELYGDFRKASQPVGTMELHFILYEVRDGAPGRILLDKVCGHETALARKTPDALMAAWDADLREIMEEIAAQYASTSGHR